LIATATLGGKAGRPPAARLFVETRKPLHVEAPTPLADDLARHVEAECDTIVAMPLDDIAAHITLRFGRTCPAARH
jgi:hypothetical protein